MVRIRSGAYQGDTTRRSTTSVHIRNWEQIISNFGVDMLHEVARGHYEQQGFPGGLSDISILVSYTYYLY